MITYIYIYHRDLNCGRLDPIVVESRSQMLRMAIADAAIRMLRNRGRRDRDRGWAAKFLCER